MEYRTFSFRIRLFLSFAFVCCNVVFAIEKRADIVYAETEGGRCWSLENEVIKLDVCQRLDGSLVMNSFYNKEAGVDYLQGTTARLFDFNGQFLPQSELSGWMNADTFALKSDEGNWVYESHEVTDIFLSSALQTVVGKQLMLSVSRENVGLKLFFELYDGRGGVRYQAVVQNRRTDAKMLIEQADVISIPFPNAPHNLHYVTNIEWTSTTGNVEEAPVYSKGKGVAKCFINLYDTQDGWYMAPEVNWKTQYGPEKPADEGYEYMHRSFAGLTAWAGGTNDIKVSTHPESFQLVLFPEEEFEYIAVNMTVFKGDIVDAKMAVEEHLRKRFRYHDTSTTFVVNDWDWFTQGLRTEEFFRTVAVPKTLEAGYEMIMFDDGWNNLNAAGNGLDNSDLSRDPVEPDARVTTDMIGFTQYIADQGLLFGLWYSNSGDNHNKGHDLASDSVLKEKQQKIEYMINNYHMAHQAVDLTQYWQNVEETSYSHPSDNVYRKMVLTRNMMNELVDRYPQYVVKVTSELDIYPTQGDRNVDLLHLTNNGWITTTGAGSAAQSAGLLFGHMPLASGYVGGGNPTGKMVDHYASMSARNVKVAQCPKDWDENGIRIMAKFNAWRHAERIRKLTNGIMRPVYFGRGWDSPTASEWNLGQGPYVWMFVDEQKTHALLIGTTDGKDLGIGNKYSLRWLDENKTYLIEDITLDDTGIVTYNFIGRYTGSELKNEGLSIEFFRNTSGGKAFWIEEYLGDEKQVVYADEHVKSYTADMSGKQLNIEATGEPAGTAKMVVYGKTEDDAMIIDVKFDDTGHFSTVVGNVTNNDVPYPGFASEIKYQMIDYHSDVVKSNDAIELFAVDNGLGQSDKSSYVKMTALNDYVIYHLPIPEAGEYEVSVNYKVSKSGRGKAQLYVVNADNEDVPLGNAFDQSTVDKEEMRTLDLGTIQAADSGVIPIKMELVGSGVSGNGLVLSLNYIVLSKK